MNRASLFGLLSLGVACTSVLGIEDLHEGPRPGAGGEDSSAGSSSGGKNGNTGGKTGGSPTDGGAPDPNAGAGNEPSGGTPGLGGIGNDAGAGGAGDNPPVTGTVKGKLQDRWGQVIANATLQIGDQQVSSDDKGVFTVPDVAATYDVSLVIGNIGWVFQGLTRRDPTLQIFSGLTDRYAYVDAGFKAGFAKVANEQISVAIATPSGNDEHNDVGTDSTFYLRPIWEGAATSTGTAHALYWAKDAVTKLPTVFKGYDTKTQALMDGVDGTPFTFDVGATTPLISKAITGTVAPYGTGSRTNSVFLRMTSGASIQFVDDTPSVNAFSYLAPEGIANAKFTVAAWEGSYYGPLGLVHKDGLAPGAAVGTMDIPAPPTVLTPSNSAVNVDEASSFSFKASADNAGTFVVVLNNLDDPQRLYIVTTQKKLTLPSVVDGAWVLSHGTEYEWWVETHGSFATVDAMTTSAGWVDEFNVEYITPVSTDQKDGTYTYSAAFSFTTKP